MDANQMGINAYENGELNIPHDLGTPDFFDWLNGWYAAYIMEVINLFQEAQQLAFKKAVKKRLADENYLDQQQKLFDEIKESHCKALERYKSKQIELKEFLKQLQKVTEELQNQLNTASESTSDKPHDKQSTKYEPGPSTPTILK